MYLFFIGEVMIGIENIAVYVPEDHIDTQDIKDRFDVNISFLETKTGMRYLTRKTKEQETSDLCCEAFHKLSKKSTFNMDEIDCLVVCTQNPDGFGLPHTSAIVHGKLGLNNECAAFDISLGCSGYVYGLSIICSFMQANGMKKGVLITADPYSKIIDESDKNTMLLFGDAATATLISSTPVWSIGKFVFGTNGVENSAIHVRESDRHLEMNGRSVFTFSASVVPDNLLEMLNKNGLDLNQVDRIILHQGSRFIVDTIRKKLGMDEAKVPFKAADYGNTVSSSIPILLENVEVSVKTIAIAGFGVGLSWASTLLTR